MHPISAYNVGEKLRKHRYSNCYRGAWAPSTPPVCALNPSSGPQPEGAIEPPEIFTNVCICMVQQQVTSFCPPEDISWLRPCPSKIFCTTFIDTTYLQFRDSAFRNTLQYERLPSLVGRGEFSFSGPSAILNWGPFWKVCDDWCHTN